MGISLAIHFDKHVTINIIQRPHDPTFCLATLFVIEVRRRFVRLDRHGDHKPFCYLASSEQSGHNGNSHPSCSLSLPQTQKRLTSDRESVDTSF
jgi:hypothetical protein